MSNMFGGCNSLTSLDVSGFDTSSVTDMSGMFVNCRGLASLDLSGFDTSSVTSMGLIFSYCSSLTSLDLSGFKTSSVTDMSGMFYDCNSLTSLDVSNFDTSSVTSMSGMFYGCSSLTSLNLSSFITSNVTNMGGIPMNVNFKDGMFGDCSSLISLDLSSFDTSSVIDMCYMFDGCSSLTSLNVSGFNTSNVTDMGYMFRNCVGLTSLDVSGFNTSSVTSMSCMFKNCVGLTNLDVSGFDTSSVTAMVYMFGGCSSLTSLDLSSFDIREIKDGEYDDDDYYYWWEGMICIFDGCSNLSTLYTPYNVPALFGDSKASLPITEESDVWFDAAGNTYTTLPEGLDYSIVLTKNAIPAPDAMQAKLMVRLAKTSYEPGSVIQPEDLTVKYRGTDGRTITLSYQGDNADVQGYTMSIVDMNTPGTKTLTISYNDGTDTLTESVTFIVLENSVDPDDPNNPTDPTDPTFPDDGTFRISAVSAQIYTGSAIKPVVTVYYGSRRLTEKTDYAVTYKNNIKANDATAEQTAPTITVTGKGNYSGKQTITFVINPKDITEEDMTVAELIAAQSNKIQKPVPTLTWQGRKLKNKTDFTVSYPDESKSGAYQMTGTYTVAVTGTGNYTGTKNLTYTITNKTLLTNAKVTVKAKDYTGSAVTLSTEDITVKVGKDTLIYGIDYTLSYRNNTQAGKATVIVTGTGDSYAGSKEVAFQIKGESLAKAQITGVVDKTYTGTAQTQNIQVQLNGKTLQEGTDYTVSYAKEVTAGTASVIVTGKGGYTGTVKKSFKIMAYDLQADEAGKLQGVPKNLTTVYVKGGATPTLTLTFNGKTLETKKDYTVTYQNNKKPATAGDAKAPTMLIKGKGNFKGIISIPFTIGVSNLETDGNVTITAADTAYVNKTGKYAVKPVLTDANGKKLTAGTDYEKTLTYALINSDGTETVLTTADIVPEGSTVKVTATGKGSYTGTLSATYHITKVSFSKAKITVNPQIYTGVPVTLSEKDVTVKIDSATLTYGKDYTIVPGSYQNNTKKGTATVTIKGMGDYGGTKTVKFKVTAKPLAAWLKF
ncbi:MAG: DUF285 domain-containing protein, partial [Acetatifactor sp.]|nr:DUF285 domain-containing protein [Acetatifactor sp.]